jgi:hypothetical protein
VVLDLTVTEAVKHVSEQKEHYNLFDDGNPGGFGFSQGGAPENIDVKTMSKDPEAYRKNRESILKKVG